ncbi:MAG TPA: methionyl-tRNA formyltransferase [Steroidobacteraceae bacterium]
MRVAYAGTPEFAVPALQALIESRHTVVGVLTQPDRPKGRGRQLASSPVKRAALAHDLPLAQPLSLKTEEGQADLVSWKPDVLVVVAYGLILPKAVLDLPRFGCVNIHASLLPRWRGAAPIQRAVLAGDAATGVTIMSMDEGLDTGPMLSQVPVPIESRDTTASLHDRLSAIGATALLESLDALEAATAKPRPQPAEGVTYAAKIEKKEAVIDWTGSADEIDRKIRAFIPTPVAETTFKGEQLRIYEASILDFCAGADPGTVAAATAAGVVISCGRNALSLQRVQRPGRQPISARDFANTPGLLGSRLG